MAKLQKKLSLSRSALMTLLHYHRSARSKIGHRISYYKRRIKKGVPGSKQVVVDEHKLGGLRSERSRNAHNISVIKRQLESMAPADSDLN